MSTSRGRPLETHAAAAALTRRIVGDEFDAERIERSGELKRALIDFASSPRFDRHLTRLMLEAAGPGGELDEGEAITIVDQFALQHQLPNGKTVLDQFLASRRDLSTADRELLRGWSDPVEALFEIQGLDGDAIILLNLLDDLEYRTYSNMGPALLCSKLGQIPIFPGNPVHPAQEQARGNTPKGIEAHRQPE